MDSTSSPLTGELPSPRMAEMQGFMGHLEELRAQNQALAEQLHQLRLQQQAQAPAPSQPVRNPILTPKPERYEGRGNLEGWISTTRDILVTCYNMDENSGAIVTTASLYLGGNARTSWDAFVRSGGSFYNWGQFEAWLRQTHGSAAPQVVQGQLLLHLKQEGKPLQEYINKWQAIAAQLPEPLTNEFAKLVFVNGLNNKFHDAATDFRVHHPNCTLQDIVVYLRSVNLQSHRRSGGQSSSRADRADPMDVDLKALMAQVRSLEQRLTQTSPTLHEEQFNKLSADELAECHKKGLCFLCKQPGHQSRQCPNRSAYKGKNRGQGMRK